MSNVRRRKSLATTGAAALMALVLGSGAAGAAAPPTPGADGAGDSYYPQDGNGGYQVAHYDLDVNYNPATHRLDGNQHIVATAKQDLSSFNLDLHGLTVKSVNVDGQRATFSRRGDHELVITPARPLWRGSVFTVDVAYGGTPKAISDPALGDSGWQYTKNGGAFVAGEPKSATTWYPVNDTPRDKATFRLKITVPGSWGVIGNGEEGQVTKGRNGTTHVWTETTPTVPYMTTVGIDKWQFRRSTLADGTPRVSAFAPGTSKATKDADARLPEVIDFLSSKFGPYPIDAAGGIYLTEPIGFSLETMSRPIYSGAAGDLGTIIHENAHQWYGDSVAVRSWKDVCLNECFASYAPWLWVEDKQNVDLDKEYRTEVASAPPELWAGKLYDMGAGNEFTWVYSKGPLALHALRHQIGDQAFFLVLRSWPLMHRDGNASMQEFQRYTERVSGQNLKGFFDAWIYGNTKPAPRYLFPGSLGRG